MALVDVEVQQPVAMLRGRFFKRAQRLCLEIACGQVEIEPVRHEVVDQPVVAILVAVKGILLDRGGAACCVALAVAVDLQNGRCDGVDVSGLQQFAVFTRIDQLPWPVIHVISDDGTVAGQGFQQRESETFGYCRCKGKEASAEHVGGIGRVSHQDHPVVALMMIDQLLQPRRALT